MKKISRFLAIRLFGVVMAGCLTNEDSIFDTSVTDSEETQSIDTTSTESRLESEESIADSLHYAL